ncbi:MAG TPA: hypothetical protein VLG72_04955 [Nitrospirota bacterium]|nr:hypothetical protein [Nitrospirota bacterium]
MKKIRPEIRIKSYGKKNTYSGFRHADLEAPRQNEAVKILLRAREGRVGTTGAVRAR